MVGLGIEEIGIGFGASASLPWTVELPGHRISPHDVLFVQGMGLPEHG